MLRRRLCWRGGARSRNDCARKDRNHEEEADDSEEEHLEVRDGFAEDITDHQHRGDPGGTAMMLKVANLR